MSAQRPPALDVARPVVTIHLPLEMGTVAAIMKAVSQAYPDATVQVGSSVVTLGTGDEAWHYTSEHGQATVLVARAER